MNNKSLVISAAIAGAATAIVSVIPFVGFLNAACCAIVIGGGVFAAWLYQQREGKIETNEGLLVGFGSGLVASLIMVVIGFAFSLLGLGIAQIADPETANPILVDLLGSVAIQGLGFVINGVTFSIAGTLGGVIGSQLFKKPKG
jgi:hypothetical protein